MKAQLLRRVCCGCIEAAAEASSSAPPPPVFIIEMSPRPPRPLPLPPSSFAPTAQRTSPAISSNNSSSNNLTICSSRGKALYTKVEGVPEEKRVEDEDGFWGKRHALPPVVVMPSAASVTSTNVSSSTSVSTFASFPHANPQPEPTNEPSPLQEESEEHPTDTSTSASTSKIPTQSLVSTSKNWAAAYVLASPTLPSADPVRESFITRLVEGVPVLKHNRKGQSRVRELCTLDNGETFTWREEGVGGEKAGGHRKHRSSAGSTLFGGARESYAFGDIIEVRRGTVPDPSSPGETGTALLRSSCEKRDLYRSFSLITADRTIDFSCDQVEDMSFLVKGFMALSHEQRRRRVRRAGSSGVGVGGA